MLALQVVQQIKKFLDEGNQSQRQIAKQLGVARGTVQAIASGRRGTHGRESPDGEDCQDASQSSGPPQRCGGCGMLVVMPCVYCRAQNYANRRMRLARGPLKAQGSQAA